MPFPSRRTKCRFLFLFTYFQPGCSGCENRISFVVSSLKKLSCPEETKMPVLLIKTITCEPKSIFFIIYFENKENSRNGKSQTMLKHCIIGPNFVGTLFDFLNAVLFYRFSVSTFCISFKINALLDLRKRKIE